MTVYVPKFLRLEEPIVYDTTVERSEILQIGSIQSTITSLNSANSQLTFSYNGDFMSRLSSPDTGFLVKLRFRTRAGNPLADNMNGDITLASNVFGYLFNMATLKLGGTIIEQIKYPGIVMDSLFHMEDAEFRCSSGILCGFIPDTSQQANEIIGTRQGANIAANAAVDVVVTAVNLPANKNIKVSNTYNAGYARRKFIYNYTVAADDGFREVELFVPLNRIFGFCLEADRVLKYLPFEIELIRTAQNTNCFFGAAGTGIDFAGGGANDTTGIISITLRLERLIVRTDVMTTLETQFSKPIEIAYLRRICEDYGQMNTEATSSYTKSMSVNDQGLLRYVICIFKNSEADNAQRNYQLCANANIQNINVEYAGNTYPYLQQNADYSRNTFMTFYMDFIKVCKSLSTKSPALSLEDFKNLYSIYAIDCTAQPMVSATSTVRINITRRAVPLDA